MSSGLDALLNAMAGWVPGGSIGPALGCLLDPIQEARAAGRFRFRVEPIARQARQLVVAQDGLAQDSAGDGVAQSTCPHRHPHGVRPAARGLGHLADEVAELGPIGTDCVDCVALAGSGSGDHEVGVVLDVYRADPVARSVRYRHERHAPGGPGDVVDEDPAPAEETRRPEDCVLQTATTHELLDDGLASEVRQVGVLAGVGDGRPDEPFDAGSCCRLDQHGRLVDGLLVRQPWGPVLAAAEAVEATAARVAEAWEAVVAAETRAAEPVAAQARLDANREAYPYRFDYRWPASC